MVEESSYAPLALGDDKAEVLRKLSGLPAISKVQPALPPRAEGSDVVPLAAARTGDRVLTAAETEYLVQYDLWYLEETNGERSVVLTFDAGALARIEARREGRWWEILF